MQGDNAIWVCKCTETGGGGGGEGFFQGGGIRPWYCGGMSLLLRGFLVEQKCYSLYKVVRI